MSLTVLILAAGQGKRMNSMLPKVLQPLAGRPLLGHVLACAQGLKAAAIHVVYGHGGEAVPAAFKEVPVRWVLQAERLGTGHAVLQALAIEGEGAIADDHCVLVLYGDVPLVRGETLARLVALAEGGAVGVLSVVLENPTGYGRIMRDSGGRVVRIVEEKDAAAAERTIREVNTGIMALPAGRLRRWLRALRNDNAQGEYYLTDVIASAVAEGVAVHALVAPTADEVLGINDKIQLAEAEAAHRRREAEALMRAGVTVVDPARIDVRGEVSAGRDVYLDVNVVLAGRVKLGDGVRIGPNCCLRDCEIGAGSEVFANCVVEESVTGADCRIGPFARLRPGTTLAEAVHIGNFVEVKKSRLGKGSKANHLTYLGDSEIGSGVNVGAGTVTCNYDGANKSSTQIGDGAFIGSGSMLVAPVRIGANATIGAGSTITRDAPADKLTLARGRQTTVEGWKRPVKGRKPKR